MRTNNPRNRSENWSIQMPMQYFQTHYAYFTDFIDVCVVNRLKFNRVYFVMCITRLRFDF